jgi:hypothetical protein
MKFRFLFLVLCAALLTALAIPSVSWALEAKVMDIEEMTKNADYVLSGKITDMKAQWEKNPTTGKKSIYTHITVQTIDVIKGKVKGNTYTFKVLGGVIPGERLAQGVAEMPQFKEGKEVFLFLHNNSSLYSPIIGFNQGKFNIEVDPGTGIRKMYSGTGSPVTEFWLTKNASKNRTDAVNYEMFKALVESKNK